MSFAALQSVDPAVAGSDARTRLRQSTAGLHELLHRQRDFRAIVSGNITLDGYAALLKRLYGFHDHFEGMLRKASPYLVSEIDLAGREKAQLLGADIIAVGARMEAFDTSRLCDRMPDVQSTEGIIGSLYVVEGAGLGGAILAKKLDRLFGADRRAGREFLFGRPRPDSLPWPRFCEILECHALTGDFAKIETAAIRTFEALSFWLNHHPRV